MKKNYLFVFLLIFCAKDLIAQTSCPYVFFRTLYQDTCTYTFQDQSNPITGTPRYDWYLNGVFQSSNTFGTYSATFANGDRVCEYLYVNTFFCGSYCYTIGCGSGCPNILQNFTYRDTGNNNTYLFSDSSFGQDTSAAISWTINSSTYNGNPVTHAWSSGGLYQICEKITEPHCATSYSICRNINVIGCPFINQNWHSYDTANNTVVFVDQSTGQDISAVYTWTFGDSTTGSGKNTRHTYPDTGYYSVIESITEPGCSPQNYYQTIHIITFEPPCNPFAQGWRYNIIGRDTVTFTDTTAILDSTSLIMWDYCVGRGDTGKTVTHIFPDTIAVCTICEVVREYPYCNSVQTHCQTIRVSPCPIVNQNFTEHYDSSTHTYTFTDASSGQDHSARYFWNFGDGDTSSLGSSVNHYYNFSGVYHVCEIITNADCSPDTFCKDISYYPCNLTIHQNFTDTYFSGGTYDFFDASTGTDFNVVYDWTVNGVLNQTGSSVTITLPTPGVYTVCEILHEPQCMPDTLCRSINYVSCPTITQNVNYTVNNTLGSYTFTDASTGQNANATYSWNFGDGHTGTGTPVNHTYAASGTYTLTETITEPGCAPYVSTGTITVTVCPVINPSFTYTAGQGGTYTFTNTSTGQNAGATWGWSFGDGSPSGSGAMVSHTYASSGSYYVYMTITEPGCTSYNYGETISVVVCPIINQSFTSWNHGGGSYTFTDASTGANANATYAWTFGDSNSGSGLSTSHTYAASGTYTVCETITEPQCSAYTPYCQQVVVDVNSAGINNIQGSSISIYPNPASQTLTINMGTTDLSGGCTISLIDQLGQISDRQTSYSEISSINLSGLPNGIYIIDIKVGSVEYHYPVSILH